MSDFQRAFSGAPWEAQIGYCRAVRAGAQIHVAGTTAVGRLDFGAYEQAKRCFEIIEAALRELGADLSRVVRTRMFVTDIARQAEFGRAHQEAFGAHPPAATMLEIRALVDPRMLIEVEVDAVAAD